MDPKPQLHRESVADHLVADVARAGAGELAGRVREQLAQRHPACVQIVAIVGSGGRLEGVVTIERLFGLAPETPVGEAMARDYPCVHPEDDQEHAASVALHRGVDALPVVDASGSLLGALPPQVLLQVLRREHVEDLHRLAGITREAARARHAIEDPPMRRARHRLPWLLAGLAGSAGATAAMAGFEDLIRAHVAVAFFIPALVYMADAIGTQSEAIAVRGLSLTRSGIAHLVAAELRTGALIGAALGVLAFAAIATLFGDARLAGAVGISLFAAGAIASGIGIAFPWAVARFGGDPAYGSGPMATVIQDTLSILVYLAVLHAFGF
ncbi:MAG: magnesium transporter [Betaproteobacteria bacterium]|nr:magnesium transporter [Betaproteobacteria bacterium]